MQLNLIFHNIVNSSAKIDNKYTVTKNYFLSLIEEVEQLIENGESTFNKYHIYFDDGYKSFHDIVYPLLGTRTSRVTLAIVTNDLDREGFLESKILKKYQIHGIQIASHGVSHAALAIYKDGQLQSTPSGGEYQNSPKGQGEALSEKEIIYQYYESKKYLESLLSTEINEFVFPYGLYNGQSVILNSKYGFYKYLSTCDEYLDQGTLLRPGVLINHERNVLDTIKHLRSIKTQVQEDRFKNEVHHFPSHSIDSLPGGDILKPDERTGLVERICFELQSEAYILNPRERVFLFCIYILCFTFL